MGKKTALLGGPGRLPRNQTVENNKPGVKESRESEDGRKRRAMEREEGWMDDYWDGRLR